MNPRMQKLHSYPFEKLRALLGTPAPSHTTDASARPLYPPLNLSIGEPKHPVPPFIRDAMAAALDDIGVYPTTRGEPFLREAIATWLEQRFHLGKKGVDPHRQILTVNGTREALFSFAQVVTHPDGPMRDANGPGNTPQDHSTPVVLLPNPFYQIYEGAAFMAGAQPFYVPCTESNNFLPDYHSVPPAVLERTTLLYLCSPANPTGAVFSLDQLTSLIKLAQRYDFVLAADECYSEIWYDHAPPGLLQAAHSMGLKDFSRCLVFHSLSKRSNMPGARSGFVAGDATLLENFFRLRTYTGCATPLFIQKAAALAWADETHVQENRAAYQRKLDDALSILRPVLPVQRPDAGFYLWLKVPGGGESFAHRLYRDYNVTVLPGAYLGRPDPSGHHPGADHIRVALVLPPKENQHAMTRIAACATQR